MGGKKTVMTSTSCTPKPVQVIHLHSLDDSMMSRQDAAVRMNGTHFSASHFSRHIRVDTDCFLDGRLLFAFRKQAVDNRDITKTLEDNLVRQFLLSDHRRVATGVSKRRVVVPSGIFGYYDKLTPQMKVKLGGVHMAGRTTAFVRRHPDKWRCLLPIFQKCSRLYRKACPVYYRGQSRFMKHVEPGLTIPGTIFSTITINKDFRTGTHTDKGDFPDGMSVLLIAGQNFRGGCLGFPRLKLLVHCTPGDIVFMDSHEPHCNTEIEYPNDHPNDSSMRYSVVCYTRTNLQKFHRRLVVDGETFYLE